MLEAGRIRHEPWRCREAHNVELAHIPTGLAERDEDVLRVNDADDVLLLVLPQRNAGKRRPQNVIQN